MAILGTIPRAVLLLAASAGLTVLLAWWLIGSGSDLQRENAWEINSAEVETPTAETGTATAPSPPAQTIDPIVVDKSNPEQVRAWQGLLVSLDYQVSADGAWGTETQIATEALQSFLGLEPTGDVTESTQKLAIELLATEAAPPSGEQAAAPSSQSQTAAPPAPPPASAPPPPSAGPPAPPQPPAPSPPTPPPAPVTTAATPTATETPSPEPAPPPPPPPPPASEPEDEEEDPNWGEDSCHPNYSPCVPNVLDVDCTGAVGDGPYWVEGPIDIVAGWDVYGLDTDGDGIGCNDPRFASADL